MTSLYISVKGSVFCLGTYSEHFLKELNLFGLFHGNFNTVLVLAFCFLEIFIICKYLLSVDIFTPQFEKNMDNICWLTKNFGH